MGDKVVEYLQGVQDSLTGGIAARMFALRDFRDEILDPPINLSWNYLILHQILFEKVAIQHPQELGFPWESAQSIQERVNNDLIRLFAVALEDEVDVTQRHSIKVFSFIRFKLTFIEELSVLPRGVSRDHQKVVLCRRSRKCVVSRHPRLVYDVPAISCDPRLPNLRKPSRNVRDKAEVFVGVRLEGLVPSVHREFQADPPVIPQQRHTAYPPPLPLYIGPTYCIIFYPPRCSKSC